MDDRTFDRIARLLAGCSGIVACLLWAWLLIIWFGH